MPEINAAHWHLIVNHFPVIGLPILAAILVWGMARGHQAVIRVALVGAVVMAGIALLASSTGEKAEHEIKDAKYAWVDRELIHDHEEAADKAKLAAILTGLLALGALVQARGGKAPHKTLTALSLFGMGVTAALMVWTTWEGGKIRHDELGHAPTLRASPPIGGERQE